MADKVNAKDALTGGAVPILTDTIATLNGVALSPTEEAQRLKQGYGADGVFIDLDEKPSVASKQDDAIAVLNALGTAIAAVVAKLSADPSTGAKQDAATNGLAAILAKLTADPATATKQDAAHTDLAAILAKLTADPSTAAKQDVTHTDLLAVLTALAAPAAGATWSSVVDISNVTPSHQIVMAASAGKAWHLTRLAVLFSPTQPSTAQTYTVYDGDSATGTVLWRVDAYGTIEEFTPPLIGTPGNQMTVLANNPAGAGLSTRIAARGFLL